MPITLNGTTGITSPGGDTSTSLSTGSLVVSGTANTSALNVGNVALGAGNATRFKNRIINGDMRIDQRNVGASVTPTTSSSPNYTLDRWRFSLNQSSKFTTQQNAGSVTPPTGFINYIGVTSSSAYSVLAGDNFDLRQNIEGLNCADLGWGTANAKTVTLSFWVRSSLTGTFGGALKNSAGDRSYPFSYTINSANTWEYETITIAGDTTGTWLTTNGIGIAVQFGLGVGSTYSGTAGAWAAANYISATGATSVVGTSGATFYITGVQLEVGSSATGFEYVDYTSQLLMCQRYFPMIAGMSISAHVNNTKTDGLFCVKLPVTPRTAPTGISVESPTGWRFNNPSNNWPISTITYGNSYGTGDYVSVAFTLSTIGATEQEGTVGTAGASYKLGFTGCEL
jgi:hypothetical protein